MNTIVIFRSITDYCIFDQIDAAMVNIRDF